MVEKICESCGMPMIKPEDFGGNRMDNHYCAHCTDAQGTLKSYEVKVKELTHFIMNRMNIDEQQATVLAKENMHKMPAWNKYADKTL